MAWLADSKFIKSPASAAAAYAPTRTLCRRRRGVLPMRKIAPLAALAAAAAATLLQTAYGRSSTSNGGGVTITFSNPTIVDDFTPSPHFGGQLGVPENFHALGSSSGGDSAPVLLGRVGPAPNGWALPAPAEEKTRWDVSVDGGTSWQHNMSAMQPGTLAAKMLRAATYYVQLDAWDGAAVAFAASAHSSWVGDSRWHVPDMTTTTFSAAGWQSVGAVTLSSSSSSSINSSGQRAATHSSATPPAIKATVDVTQIWEWKGIPAPGLNITASRKYNGPRIYSIIGLGGGGFVAAVCIHFNGARVGKEGPELTIVSFTSDDGYGWQYGGIIASASAGKYGPTEPDLAVLSDSSTILCVLRLDGDGPCHGGSYEYYHQSYSTDNGVTWSKEVTPINGTGCARPRLLATEMGPLLMSGGRLCVEDTADISLWLNADGMAGWSSTADGADGSGIHGSSDPLQWVKHSISYHHNLLWKGGSEYLFSAAVNATTTETLSYTSLVPSGPDTGFVFYNRFFPVRGVPWPGRNVNFAMQYQLTQQTSQ